MIELIKNIGLGLFVNSSYAIMGVCIYAERGEQ